MVMQSLYKAFKAPEWIPRNSSQEIASAGMRLDSLCWQSIKLGTFGGEMRKTMQNYSEAHQNCGYAYWYQHIWEHCNSVVCKDVVQVVRQHFTRNFAISQG